MPLELSSLFPKKYQTRCLIVVVAYLTATLNTYHLGLLLFQQHFEIAEALYSLRASRISVAHRLRMCSTSAMSCESGTPMNGWSYGRRLPLRQALSYTYTDVCPILFRVTLGFCYLL